MPIFCYKHRIHENWIDLVLCMYAFVTFCNSRTWLIHPLFGVNFLFVFFFLFVCASTFSLRVHTDFTRLLSKKKNKHCFLKVPVNEVYIENIAKISSDSRGFVKFPFFSGSNAPTAMCSPHVKYQMVQVTGEMKPKRLAFNAFKYRFSRALFDSHHFYFYCECVCLRVFSLPNCILYCILSFGQFDTQDSKISEYLLWNVFLFVCFFPLAVRWTGGGKMHFLNCYFTFCILCGSLTWPHHVAYQCKCSKIDKSPPKCFFFFYFLSLIRLP